MAGHDRPPTRLLPQDLGHDPKEKQTRILVCEDSRFWYADSEGRVLDTCYGGAARIATELRAAGYNAVTQNELIAHLERTIEAAAGVFEKLARGELRLGLTDASRLARELRSVLGGTHRLPEAVHVDG